MTSVYQVNYCWHFQWFVWNFIFPHFPMEQQSLVNQDLLITEVSRSLSDTPHSMGLLWKTDQPNCLTNHGWWFCTDIRSVYTGCIYAECEHISPSFLWTNIWSLCMRIVNLFTRLACFIQTRVSACNKTETCSCQIFWIQICVASRRGCVPRNS